VQRPDAQHAPGRDPHLLPVLHAASRSAIGAGELPFGMPVEVEAVAALA
jgi:enamine deaminase RidA (YjgF/YER057c/UK114 family)